MTHLHLNFLFTSPLIRNDGFVEIHVVNMLGPLNAFCKYVGIIKARRRVSKSHGLTVVRPRKKNCYFALHLEICMHQLKVYAF